MWGDKAPKFEDLYSQLQPSDTKFFEARERERIEKDERNRSHAAGISDRLAQVAPPEGTGKKAKTRK